LLKIITRSSRNLEELIRKIRAVENVINTNTVTVLNTLKGELSVKPD
jgi:DNA-binding Lrp family transcriptional regulator